MQQKPLRRDISATRPIAAVKEWQRSADRLPSGFAEERSSLHRAPTRFWLLFLLSLTCVPQAEAQEGGKPFAVDLELILAVDVSRSMDDEEFRVQRNGYIDAIRHPDFIRAITSGGAGRIALTYVEWSTRLYQKVVVPWQL